MPAHEIPPVCTCGLGASVHTAPAEEMLRYMRDACRHLKPTARDHRLLAQWSCPARPGATRPTSDREKRYGSFGNKCALRDRWPGHNIRGDSHRNSEQMSVDQSNYLRKNQQVVGRTGRIKPDGIPRPLPGAEVPGW